MKSVLIWQAFHWCEFFTVQFASSKIHFQFLFMWQEIHQGKCETNVLLFTSISYERKHVSDLSMLVFCFRGHTFVVYLRTTKVHNNSVFKELTLHFLLQESHLWNSPCLRISNRKYPPMPSEFHNRAPPLPFGNPKSRPWYSMDIFWNRPFNFSFTLNEIPTKSIIFYFSFHVPLGKKSNDCIFSTEY